MSFINNLYYKIIKFNHIIILYLLWGVSVLSFLNFIPVSINIILIILFVYNFIQVLIYPSLFFIFLPFIILLSPIFGAINILGFNMLFSDFFLFYYFIIFFTRNKYFLHSITFFSFFIIIYLFIIFHFLFNDLISLKPILSITELFLIYTITKHKLYLLNINSFLFSILSSVIIGTFLMFLSFTKGISLAEFNGEDAKNFLKNANDFDPSQFKLNYFYTNFSILIGCSIFLANYFITLSNNVYQKIILYIIMIYLLIALISSGNKTTLFITIFILFLTNLIFNFKSFLNYKNILFFTTLFFLGFYFFNKIILNDDNKDLFLDRLKSTDSLIDRFGVYKNAFDLIIQNPHRIFLGYGPDFLTNAGDTKVSNLYKINSYTKDEQGALDSGIITFMIEFGIFIFLYISSNFIIILYKLYKKITIQNLMLFQLLLTFILSGFTQLIGISKISWFLIILFVISKKSSLNIIKH